LSLSRRDPTLTNKHAVTAAGVLDANPKMEIDSPTWLGNWRFELLMLLLSCHEKQANRFAGSSIHSIFSLALSINRLWHIWRMMMIADIDAPRGKM